MPSPAASVATMIDGFCSKNSRSAAIRFSSDMPPWIVQQWKPRFVSLPTRKSRVSLCSVKTRSRSACPERCCGNDVAEFLELGFGDVLLSVLGELHEAVEFFDLGLQFGHVLGHREPLNEVVLELPALGFGQIVQVFGQFAKFLLELAELLQVSEPLEAAFQRQADGGQAGGQAALQDGQSQADVAVLGGLRALKVVLHVIGDGLVQVHSSAVSL